MKDNRPNKLETELGLFHSLEYLQKIRYEIVFWQIEKQAEHADRTCVLTVDTVCLCIFSADCNSIGGIIDIEFLSKYNSTSIGNMAYISLHTKNEYVRKFALKQLNLYKIYVAYEVSERLKTNCKVLNNIISPIMKEAIENYNKELSEFYDSEFYDSESCNSK